MNIQIHPYLQVVVAKWTYCNLNFIQAILQKENTKKTIYKIKNE